MPAKCFLKATFAFVFPVLANAELCLSVARRYRLPPRYRLRLAEVTPFSVWLGVVGGTEVACHSCSNETVEKPLRKSMAERAGVLI